MTRVDTRTSRGYTIIELLVVVSILGAMILVTIPNIRGRYETYLLRNSTRGFAAILKLGRMKAVSNNVNYIVELNGALTGECPGEVGTRNAMVVYEEGQTSPDECYVSHSGVRVESLAPASDDTVLFRPNGMATNTAPNYFLVQSRSVNNPECQLVCVNAAGIVRANPAGRGSTFCTSPYGTTNSTDCPKDPSW